MVSDFRNKRIISHAGYTLKVLNWDKEKFLEIKIRGYEHFGNSYNLSLWKAAPIISPICRSNFPRDRHLEQSIII